MLPKNRLRDLQRVDQLGATYAEGAYKVGGEDVPWTAYEWLWSAGYLELRGNQLLPTERAEAHLSTPREREWLLTVRVASPKTPVHLRSGAASSDIYAYEKATGKTIPADNGDDELFLEDVARLAAVRRHVDENRIWLRNGGRITNLETGEEFTGEVGSLFRWGPLSREDEGLNPHPAERLANGYHQLPIFTRNAGRRTALADASYESLVAAVAEVAPTSGKVVVKVTRPKYGIYTLDASGGSEDAVMNCEGAMLALMHLEGDAAVFLVQEHVAMTFERRFFVIDHIAVASAGCLDEYSPFDRVVPHSDPRMRRHRAESDILWAPEQTGRLTEFVGKITREIRQSAWAEKMTEYVVDVAFGPDGEPLIVEFNGIRNSGLYASDHGAVIRRLAEREDVWGKAPHARPSGVHAAG